MPDHHLTVTQALARLPGPNGERFVELFGHGTLSVELYAPRENDPQSPHPRDEVYVVAAGRGQFRNGEARHPFRRVTCCSSRPAWRTASRSSATTWRCGCSSTVRRAGKYRDRLMEADSDSGENSPGTAPKRRAPKTLGHLFATTRPPRRSVA
jgi:hypothetical protein